MKEKERQDGSYDYQHTNEQSVCFEVDPDRLATLLDFAAMIASFEHEIDGTTIHDKRKGDLLVRRVEESGITALIKYNEDQSVQGVAIKDGVVVRVCGIEEATRATANEFVIQFEEDFTSVQPTEAPTFGLLFDANEISPTGGIESDPSVPYGV